MKMDTELYCEQMEEIIHRDKLLRELITGKITLGSDVYDYEVFALNMRKILELIAFASLIASKDKYSEEYKNFEVHYKAKAILDDIEKIHPQFFPIPAKITNKKDGTRNLGINQESNPLTKDEFKELYDKCTAIIHAWKPYKKADRKVDFRLLPLEWLNKIKELLNTHYVHLPNDKGVWLCLMMDPDKPHVYTLEKA